MFSLLLCVRAGLGSEVLDLKKRLCARSAAKDFSLSSASISIFCFLTSSAASSSRASTSVRFPNALPTAAVLRAVFGSLGGADAGVSAIVN